MVRMTLTIGLVLAVAGTAYGYSAGAPETVCDDMTPKHPAAPKTTPIPYKVTPPTSEIKPGEEIELMISGANEFKGFLIEIRDGDKAVGSFQIADTDRYAKTINCHGNPKSAATHKNATPKNNKKITWKAPPKAGNYKIFITVAQNGDIYWAHHEVGVINVA